MLKINPKIDDMTSFLVMDVLEKANEMQSNGIDVVHLEVGEPNYEPSKEVVDAARSAYLSGDTHYTHSLGDPDLRTEICSFYHSEYGVEIEPDQVIVTSGSSPAILMSLMAICEAGSEVIITNPGYPCYKNFILAAGCKPVEVNVSAENGFIYDVDKLKAAVTSKTRAIFVNSPMNPAGTLVSKECYEKIAELGITIISDEIYHGLTYGGDTPICALQVTRNAIILNGFSKRYAMTGLRLGYAIVPKECVRPMQILQQNLFICASSTAQKAGITALKYGEKDVEERRKVYDEKRKFMIRRLREIGFEIESEPMGAFYVFCNAKKFTNNSLQFAFDILEKAHVGITPGIDFGTGGEGYVRLSYANSMDRIEEGLNRIERYINSLNGVQKG
ncbi:MAG: pyridoxal phosphate-dependent aminotransferase [Paludibacteraceae bacterium]|nr:pyridoxal phosphate-dependent aminotransferase [Paludibacteraceae bacterium]